MSPRPTAWVTGLLAVMLIGAVWMMVLLRLGVSDAIRMPGAGVLSHTFNGWVEHPEARRYLLAQYNADDFAHGKSYTSYTYPFLITMYLLVEPFHLALGLPYDVAHNLIACVDVICLSLLLVFVARDQLLALFARRMPLYWLLALLSIGVVVTDPLVWVSLLMFNRDSFHVLSVASFCYLSTWVFRDEIPDRPLLAVGIFLACWSPIYAPAWILAVVFFSRALVLQRRRIFEIVGVSALAVLNLVGPVWVGRWAGYTSVSSGFSYRSGLDGSTQYMTSVYQAIVAPIEPRHWPVAFVLVMTTVLGAYFQFAFGGTVARRPLQQALFLTIPYATIAIGFPQFTSIHPYFSDLLLFIPATFLMAFWFLQEEHWRNLNGPAYVVWLLVTGLVLMTNLLTVAQDLNPRALASRFIQ